MSPAFDKRIPAALLILRFFLATFLLQWSIEKLILPGAAARIASNFYGVTLPVAGSYALGIPELIVSCAVGRIPADDQLRPLAAHSYRDRGRELAAIVRSVGAGQGGQSSVDLHLADLGRFCRAVPDAGLGQLDHRRLAPGGKPDRPGDEPLAVQDQIPVDTTQEQCHGYRQGENHRHAAPSW